MISETLEQDLQRYAKRRDKKLFNEKLYAPVVHIIQWVLSKEYNNCSLSDKEDLTQLALIRITKDMHYYRDNKGRTAVSFMRLLVRQEIHKQKHRIERREVEEEYKADSDCRAEDHNNYSITVTEMVEVLSKYRNTVGLELDNVKVIDALVTVLRVDYLAWVKAKSITKIAMIKKHSKTTNQSIIDTLALIRDARLMQ